MENRDVLSEAGKGKKRILIYIVDLFSNQADRTKGCGEW